MRFSSSLKYTIWCLSYLRIICALMIFLYSSPEKYSISSGSSIIPSSTKYFKWIGQNSFIFSIGISSIIIWLFSAGIARIGIHAAWFYLSLPVVCMSFGILLVFKRLDNRRLDAKCGRFIVGLSYLTFGVYLLHGLVIYLLSQAEPIHRMNTCIVGLIAFLLSLVAAYLISFLPFKKLFLG